MAGCRPKTLAPFQGEVTLAVQPGASIERLVRGGERQAFSLRLGADAFVSLEISQRSVSLSSRVLNPEGEELAAGEGTESPGLQRLDLISGSGGVFRIEILARGSPKRSSRYQVRVREARRAGPGDEDRIAAGKALTEGRQLMAGKSPTALSRLQAALASWRKAADARGEAMALADVGSFEEAQGNRQAAFGWYQKALARSRQSGAQDLEAWTLSKMGFCSRGLMKYDQSAELYKQSLAIWERVGGPWEQAYVLLGLGNAYQEKGDSALELQTFEKALPLAVASGELAQQAQALLNIGTSHYAQFHLREARETWEKALELSRQAGNAEVEAFAEQNLAAIYLNQGKFQRALELFSQAVDKVPATSAGVMRLNMGNLYFELGNPEKALQNYELARAAFAGRQVDEEALALVGIGRARQRMGDPRAALAEYEKARRLMPEDPSVAYAMGLALLDLNEPGQALSSLQRALALARAKKSRTRETSSLFALGMVYTRLGQPAEAAECLSQAIALGNDIEYTSVVVLSLLKRAQLHRDQGQLEAALADARNALSIIESSRRNIALDRFRIGFSASRRTYYDLTMDLLMRLGRKAEALNISESAKARGLLDLLAEGRIDVSQGLAPDLRRREEDLANEISQTQQGLRASDTPERARELRSEFQKLTGQREQLDLEIRTRNKRYAQVRYPVPLTLSEIQDRLLDERTALLEYYLGESRSTLFVITRKGMSTYDLPPASRISEQVRRLRTALDKESVLTRKDYLESALQLYDELLAPAAKELAGKPNLLISPDGVLFYIPFEALLTEPPGERSYQDLPYLLRRHAIAYVPSASVLAGLREPRQEPPATNRMRVAVFAPFALSRSKAFDRLRASEQEAREIAGLYPGSALSFIGQDATEDRVTRNPAVALARRLHFATHAKIDERYPESSALILAARRGSGDDEFLQVPKIFNLKLSADLVVLSACQTAMGQEVTGEGLVGLTRAFFYAGAPSLVVSLWNVADGPTPELMVDFYRDLDHLQEKAKALQTAKLAMIRRGTYPHPSNWAPFILLGEPR